MIKRILFLLLITLYLGSLYSQATIKVDLIRNSWLAINGTTNVLAFKMIQNGEKLVGKSVTITATQKQNKIYLSQNQLAIHVKNFSSDNPMALRDFKKLIKADSYPNINAQLNYIETSAQEDKELNSRQNASVNITITGVSRQYIIPVWSSKHTDFVSVVGSKKISIRDFGLEPPVEMLGLIKVSEWIDIDFKLVCKLSINNEDLALTQVP